MRKKDPAGQKSHHPTLTQEGKLRLHINNTKERQTYE
jgi:hypothetical protein